MPAFIVSPSEKSLGPTFNEAAKILAAASKDVTLINKFEHLGLFLIEGSDTAVAKVKKSLPGWTFEKEQSFGIN